MKRFYTRLVRIVVGLVVVGVVAWATYQFIALPWIDRWGATEAEISAAYPGDDLVPAPLSVVNRAVTIQAAPEAIYPWLIQMGADRGGLYSYTWLEGLANCPIANADRIHPEWQNLKVGDLVRLCPKDPGPPPYIVAALTPNRSMVLGHQENGRWVELWQFTLVPQAGGASRLVTRTRTRMVGGFWDVLHPLSFIMERGLLLGVKQRVEK